MIESVIRKLELSNKIPTVIEKVQHGEKDEIYGRVYQQKAAAVCRQA